LPRHTRRTRNQAPSLGKGQQPAVPAHFYRRVAAPTVEPAPGGEELAGQPDIDSVTRDLIAGRNTLATSPESLGVVASPRAGASVRQQPARDRLGVTDYGYVIGELKRIFLTAGIIFTLLILIAIAQH
jgi:hypothetical protein